MRKTRFTIRFKSIFLLATVSIILATSLGIYLNIVVKNSFEEIENTQAINAMERVEKYLENSIQTQASKINDWAKWDDAHYFMLEKNNDFIHTNLRNPEVTFNSLNSDILIFINKKNKVLYSKSYDKINKSYTNNVENIFDQFKNLDITKDSVGFLNDSKLNLYMLYIMRTTTTTDIDAPISGAIFSALYLDQHFIKKMNEDIKYKVSFKSPIDTLSLSRPNSRTLTIQKNIKNMNNLGAPLFSAVIELERPVYMIFLNTFQNLLISLFVTIFVMNGLLYLLISKGILVRLNSIQSWLIDFKETKSFKPLLVTQNDELSDAMTALNEMAENLQKYHLELESKNKQFVVNSKMVALGEMASGIAHEINSPLATIQGRASQLLRSIENNSANAEITKKYLDIIISTTDRIAKIIKGLKTFSRKSELNNTDEFHQYKIVPVIEETINLSKDNLKQKNIELRFKNKINATLKGSGLQISQVLLNLFNNSRDAIENLKEKWIEVDITKPYPNLLQITITDSGKGIPTDVVEKMMQPFFTTKPVGKGTGLGLSISKGIIENHGGAFYYNPESKNTQFIIELPCQKEAVSA